MLSSPLLLSDGFLQQGSISRATEPPLSLGNHLMASWFFFLRTAWVIFAGFTSVKLTFVKRQVLMSALSLSAVKRFFCVCVCVLLSFACCWRKARVYCRVVRPPALPCCARACTGLPLHLSWMLCQPVPSNHVPCCWVVLHSAEIVPRGKGLIGIFQIRSGQEFPR